VGAITQEECPLSLRLRGRDIMYHFEMDRYCLCLDGSSFISKVVLGVREGNLYRLRGHPMSVVANRRRETDEEDQVAP
jgi:hypothetical protein